MKQQRILAICVALCLLMISAVSSNADERVTIGHLGGTTIGGYVDSSVSVQPKPALQARLWRYFRWFGFYSRP